MKKQTRRETLGDDPLWYKDAVIYQLHVKSFFDSNDDGVGDFAGLLRKLDYIVDLGANVVWLLPFYPSPRRDDGYDISYYFGIHPEYGKMQDFRRFVDAAHQRGLRVITELVINHTSDQHPWFQRARRAKPGSAARNYYVWSDNDKLYDGTRIIFSDTEKSNWTWDPVANAYFWHRFYSHQPDLNFDNPRLIDAVLHVMRQWLDMGVDGLRLDAVPYLVERDGTSNENLPETHDILKRIRAEVDQRYADRVLLAEANQWPEDVQQYFGAGDECHMAFHFPLMPRMYMAIAQEDRFPITDIMRQTPDIPENCQWAIFLRNHDELTLEMVTDRERDYLWEVYARDRRARLNLGIRRRLAPLLERDRRRIELMNSLLLTMPGTPIIYYGDEIGMGDNLHLGDRDGVRTPMQWSSDRNGGFSRADPAELVLPPIMDPLYGFPSVNVEAQERDPHSLLNWVRRMLVVRREHKAFGRGRLRFLRPRNRKVLAYLREHEDEILLCVANVARTAQAVELELSEFAGLVPIELTGRSSFPPIGQLTYLLTLPPYGFYSFMLCPNSERPNWSTAPSTIPPEHHTFVLRRNLDEIFASSRLTLEHDILPSYLSTARWFQGKNLKIDSITVLPASNALAPTSEHVFTNIEVRSGAETTRYQLPIAISWEDETPWPLGSQLALARVRQGRRVGLLTDAAADPAFIRGLLDGFANATLVSTELGEISFNPTPLFAEMQVAASTAFEWPGGEQSNSSILIGQKAILKLIRRLVPGLHPEGEMSRRLTAAGFANTAPFFGDIVQKTPTGEIYTLALMQGFVLNQGDGWNWTLDYLGRTLDEILVTGLNQPSEEDSFASYEALSRILGTRLGEMHQALAEPVDDDAFRPEEIKPDEAARLAKDVQAQLAAAIDALQAHDDWQGDDKAAAEKLAGQRGKLNAVIEQLANGAVGTLMTRIHGDLHLGQVLITAGDVTIIDFEGEPTKSLEERRAKASPWRDAAGILRSFEYASAMVEKSRRSSGGPYVSADPRKILGRFERAVSAAFIDAYVTAAPKALDQSRPLLDLFLLQKAAYEICYEAANRPTWIDVPLRGLSEIANQLLEQKERS